LLGEATRLVFLEQVVIDMLFVPRLKGPGIDGLPGAGVTGGGEKSFCVGRRQGFGKI
jgi:hypothetical protein